MSTYIVSSPKRTLSPQTFDHSVPRRNTLDLESLTPYQHRPLESLDSLRILQLQPGGEEERIFCELQHWDAAKVKANEYEALSWCWGESDNNQSIRIMAGKAFSFRVYGHLYDALLALRHYDKPRYLWIDAVCIDQGNIDERNQQVSRMDEIYGGASNVCVWLGEAKANSDQALDFISNRVLEVHDFDQLRTDGQYIDEWKAILDLMKRNWFNRRWVVQEVSLARQATMHCGKKTINWKEFAAAVSLLVDVDSAASTLSKLASKPEKFSRIHDLFTEVPDLGATTLVTITERLFKRSATGITQRTSSLEDIVARLATFKTSEPRDTIYALLTLANDSHPSVGGIPEVLYGRRLSDKEKKVLQLVARRLPNPYKQKYEVNYKQPIIDVYQQFIKFAIARSNPVMALDIICRPFAPSYTFEMDVNYSKELKSKLLNPSELVPQPSWIPNVDKLPYNNQSQSKPGRIHRMERQHGDLFVSTPDRFPYSAAGSRTYDPVKVRFRKRTFDDPAKDHYSMYVEGFVLTKITNRLPSSQNGTIPANWLKIREKYRDIRDPETDVFWRILVADRGPKGPAPLYYKHAIEASLDRSTSREFNTDKHIREGESETITRVLGRVQATIQSRSLIEAERGLLGLAPEDTEEGDLICILYGCTVPVILRQFAKEQDDVEKEKEIDEADRLERQEKVEPTIRSIFERKRRKRDERKAIALENNGPRRVPILFNPQVARGHSALPWNRQISQSALFLVIQPASRRVLLLLLGIFGMQWLLGEDLASSILALLAAPHILMDLRNTTRSFKTYWAAFRRNQNDFVAVSALVLLCTTCLMATKLFPTLSASLVLLMFVTFYPEVLPPEFAKAYARIQRKLWLASPAELLSPVFPATGHSSRIAESRKVKIEDGREPLNQSCYYKLIGESYVHNMMNGEAIKWQNESFSGSSEYHVHSTIFELR